MVDRNLRSDAGSEKSSDAKQSATVHDYPSSETDTYLVEYPDGSVEYEPNTLLNRLIFGESPSDEGAFDDVRGTHRIHVDDDVYTVTVSLLDDQYVITKNGHSVTVPEEERRRLINALLADDKRERVAELYNELIVGQVRLDIVEQFRDQFPDERVEETSQGWIVDDTFLVTWDGENFLTANTPTYVREGNEMVETDETKEGVELTFDVEERATLRTNDGNAVEVTAAEQEFLATVEALLFPKEYLGVELVDEIEQARAESTAASISDIAKTGRSHGFKTTESGEYHGHSLTKHRLQDSFNFTDEAIRRFKSKPYSHISVTEAAIREDEFRNASYDVFTDVENDNDERWESINNTKENAPVSFEALRELKENLAEEGINVDISY